MTAKAKANELVEKYYGITDVNFGMKQQKKCAIKCVDEIIKTIQPHLSTEWWQEVKEEIMKL